MSETEKSRLYIAVVAHVDRLEMAEALASAVQANDLFMDDGFLGEWKNHEKAWRKAHRSNADHAVILQDDAIPVDNFRKHAQAAVDQCPDKLISFYTGTYRPREQQVNIAVKRADQIEASWLSADTLMWGVGVAVPVRLIDEILDTVKKSKLPYDQRIGHWAELRGEDVYYTWPSLVDHADESTVIAGRSKFQGKRVAHKTGVPLWNDRTVRIERPESFITASTRDR